MIKAPPLARRRLTPKTKPHYINPSNQHGYSSVTCIKGSKVPSVLTGLFFPVLLQRSYFHKYFLALQRRLLRRGILENKICFVPQINKDHSVAVHLAGEDLFRKLIQDLTLEHAL
jgi:hypothetical protein